MVMALPRETASNEPDVYEALLGLIRVATEYIDVAVMIPNRWPEIEARVLRDFANEPGLRARLHFVPSPVSSVWTRDYLPQYGLGKSG